MTEQRKAVRLIIRGRVQGVGYRAWAERQASALGLDGWVRNREDGSVEAIAAGEPGAVDRMVEAARVGPPAALVTDVETVPAPDPGATGFAQRR